MKHNKGQGSLEYLLIMGGAILVSVIIITAIIRTGSRNAKIAEERNAATLNATDVPLASIIISIKCLDNGSALIKWKPLHKDGYEYFLSINGNVCEECAGIESVVNPIIIPGGCSDLPASFVITTKHGDKTSASNVMQIKGSENVTVPKVATPTATPPGGNYSSSQNVTLSCTTMGATIRYTINNTDPSCSSGTIYFNIINVSSTTTIKAIACKDGYDPSTVMVEKYEIGSVGSAPGNSLEYFVSKDSMELTLSPDDLKLTGLLFLRFLDLKNGIIVDSDPQATFELLKNGESPYNFKLEDLKLLFLLEQSYDMMIEKNEIGDILIIDSKFGDTLKTIPAKNISVAK